MKNKIYKKFPPVVVLPFQFKIMPINSNSLLKRFGNVNETTKSSMNFHKMITNDVTTFQNKCHG